MIDVKSLQDKIGIHFKDLNLLNQAFTHRSYLNEIKQDLQSNERLEFLGDSVLSFIVSSYLFEIRPKDEEGNLTNLRAFIVKTKSLGEAALELKLGDYLKLSKGEEIGGGRINPQLMANTFESLVGAIYLDQGIEVVTEFIHKYLLPYFEKEIKSGPPKDAKSSLQETIQTESKQSPHYKVIKTDGPDHAKKFTVGVFVKGEKLGEGVGSSKQEAEEHAATEALDKLSK